jgi:hypothetical protein
MTVRWFAGKCNEVLDMTAVDQDRVFSFEELRCSLSLPCCGLLVAGDRSSEHRDGVIADEDAVWMTIEPLDAAINAQRTSPKPREHFSREQRLVVPGVSGTTS